MDLSEKINKLTGLELVLFLHYILDERFFDGTPNDELMEILHMDSLRNFKEAKSSLVKKGLIVPDEDTTFLGDEVYNFIQRRYIDQTQLKQLISGVQHGDKASQ